MCNIVLFYFISLYIFQMICVFYICICLRKKYIQLQKFATTNCIICNSLFSDKDYRRNTNQITNSNLIKIRIPLNDYEMKLLSAFPPKIKFPPSFVFVLRGGGVGGLLWLLLLLLMVCDSCESLEPVGAPYVVSPIAIWGTL